MLFLRCGCWLAGVGAASPRAARAAIAKSGDGSHDPSAPCVGGNSIFREALQSRQGSKFSASNATPNETVCAPAVG